MCVFPWVFLFEKINFVEQCRIFRDSSFNLHRKILEILGSWKLLPFTQSEYYQGVYTLKKGTLQETLQKYEKLKILNSQSRKNLKFFSNVQKRSPNEYSNDDGQLYYLESFASKLFSRPFVNSFVVYVYQTCSDSLS